MDWICLAPLRRIISRHESHLMWWRVFQKILMRYLRFSEELCTISLARSRSITKKRLVQCKTWNIRQYIYKTKNFWHVSGTGLWNMHAKSTGYIYIGWLLLETCWQQVFLCQVLGSDFFHLEDVKHIGCLHLAANYSRRVKIRLQPVWDSKHLKTTGFNDCCSVIIDSTI